MSYSARGKDLRKQRLWGCFVFVIIQLVSWPQPSASEIRLSKQFMARVDDHKVDCAFAGGMTCSKPAFVDFDADGDLDVLVGDENGCLRFFRNQGTSQAPFWDLVPNFCDGSAGTRSCPVFVDVDDDGNPDLFVGNREGRLTRFGNNGTPDTPLFVRVSDPLDSIDVGSEAAPFFVDVDADSDPDLFVGKSDGRLSFYRNDGTRQVPLWNLVSEYYDSIDVGANSVPFFTDMDRDDDFDLFVGEDQGNLNYYRNVGNHSLPRWELASTDYNSIEIGRRSAPVFADIDNDSDLDLFIGGDQGQLCFYRNDGGPHLPSWTPITGNYLYLDLGAYSAPALADIDADGDNDLFAGEYEGKIRFYRTGETIPAPSWTKVTEDYFAIEADDFSSPEFGDVDADGDLDLLVGRKDGKIELYRNIGNPQSALWNPEYDQLSSVDVGGYASPSLADIDGDADLDLLVGQTHGKIHFYRNDGTPQVPFWVLVTDQLESIDVGWYSSPALGDLDFDGDLDLLVGDDEGRISFYLNDGSPGEFAFIPWAVQHDSVDVGERSTPALSDFDSDGDLDLFVGEAAGGLRYYKNLALNSIRGRVSDGADPLPYEVVYLSGDKDDSTRTDSAGDYRFVGLPPGDYCVFREPSTFQYCFSPLESDAFDVNFIGATQVEEIQERSSPHEPQLWPNYPNPFNPVTNVTYFLPWDGEIDLTVYNLKGQKVRDLIHGPQTKGRKTILWDGTDSQGRPVASGVYFCRLKTDRLSEIIRMVLLK